MTETEILDALEKGVPFRDLPGLTVTEVQRRGEGPFDVTLAIDYGGNTLTIYGEIKNVCTPKVARELAPWLARMKGLQKEAAFALISPALSPETQSICRENNVDFIDLAGNFRINVPGKFLLERVGLKDKGRLRRSLYRDPFSGKASRVLRVLLERPGEWSLKRVARELSTETQRNQLGNWDFNISVASISKTLRSLEEELLVRRRDSRILTPEPRRLLSRWAQKYMERHRWYLRRSFKCRNCFGGDLRAVAEGIRRLVGPGGFAFTGAAAATTYAPFVDLDLIEIFMQPAAAQRLGAVNGQADLGPKIRLIHPYDEGVFMYGEMREEIPYVSPTQAYLDLYARGGRDRRQADHLLLSVIEPQWSGRDS